MSTSTHTDATAATSTVTLDAVNEMLETIGEPPVTALDSAGTSDEAQAEAMLVRWRKRILRKGWFSNTLIDKEYTADGSNEYTMTSVLHFKHTSNSSGLQLALRTGKLYDMKEDRSTFPNNATIKLHTIMDVGLTLLPDGLRLYIITAAAQDFLRFKMPDRFNEATSQDEVDRARSMALTENIELGRINLLTTWESRDVAGGRRYNMGRTSIGM
jgi:hypothetical protein